MQEKIDEILNKLRNIQDSLESMDEKICLLETKFQIYSGIDISERIMVCWEKIENQESKLNDGFDRLNQFMMGNNERFCSMVNEYKGILAQERSHFMEKKKLLRVLLGALEKIE